VSVPAVNANCGSTAMGTVCRRLRAVMVPTLDGDSRAGTQGVKVQQ